MNKFHNWINTGLIVLVAILLLVGNQPGQGGVTNYDTLDTTDGYKVDGTTVIDGDGNIVASITTDTITASGETSVQGFTQGGGCTASTTLVATELWTEADLLGSNCFVYSGGAGTLAITITLPATSTMTTLIPNAGDTRSWFYDPSGYVAATTTTFAAGTGIILMEPNDGDDSNVVIAGATGAAMITLMRRSDEDVYAVIEEISDAD